MPDLDVHAVRVHTSYRIAGSPRAGACYYFKYCWTPHGKVFQLSSTTPLVVSFCRRSAGSMTLRAETHMPSVAIAPIVNDDRGIAAGVPL